jgi:hypothetical protein
MPIPAKPCEGRFSDEVLEVLQKNTDRAQWANHTCQTCGVAVGATLDKGKWVPEQHWPSVKYHYKNANEKKQGNSADSAAGNDVTTLAESASR